MTASITFYSLVLFVHIAAIVVAFGVTFTYPLTIPFTQRAEPRSVAYLHRLQVLIGTRIITPAATLALVTGIYLVADSDVHELADWWISFGFAALILLLGLAGAYFTPRERRLAELAQRDADGAGGAELTFSDEYETLARQVGLVGALASLLILVAIFTMVMGSRGYL